MRPWFYEFNVEHYYTASLDAVVQGDEELVTHTAIMADLAGLGNAMERIDGDAMMLSYGLYGLLHIAGEL